MMLFNTITKDDRVEIAATFMGAFILGASFAKDFFMHGRFEGRVFFFGVSCLILFLAVSIIADIRIQLFSWQKKWISILGVVLFFVGNIAALELFKFQFKSSYLNENMRVLTLVFLVCYSSLTNLLYFINRPVLKEALRVKTIYKYLLAPINGISSGVIVTGLIVWFMY